MASSGKKTPHWLRCSMWLQSNAVIVAKGPAKLLAALQDGETRVCAGQSLGLMSSYNDDKTCGGS